MMGGFGGCCGGSWFGGMWGLGWIGILVNVLVLLGIVALVVWLARRLVGNGARTEHSQISGSEGRSPREILSVRYARGEIDRDQYMSMLSDLG